MKAVKQLQRKEKNKMNKKIAFITTAFAVCALTGCSTKEKEEMPSNFGIFSYEEAFLKEYACKTINSEEAKNLIVESETNTNRKLLKVGYDSETSADTAKYILTKCGALIVTTNYCIDDTNKQQERKDLFQGTDFMNLLIESHYVPFAELSASINGGIGSTSREDCELAFDEEGKINLWQTSLGLYTAAPTGTVRDGYIFEASFEWLSK